jgi:ArsR family transcriptional regulator
MKQVVALMKSLSDETRLRMLNVLLVRECCVCDIMAALEISQTRASRNLSILEKAGLLGSRRVGVWRHYFLMNAKENAAMSAVLKIVTEFARKDPLCRQDRARLEKATCINKSLGNNVCQANNV